MNPDKPLGPVVAVSVGKMSVGISEPSAAETVEVGRLCAVPHEDSNSWLIGMIDQIRRTPESSTEGPKVAMMDVTMIGQFISRDKGGGQFKRGTDAYPRLGTACFHLDGEHLLKLLQSVNATFDPQERFELGTFTLDQSARASISGNRFFQRHAAVLGSTGSGKSWTVALLLEKASQLKSANIVLFDLHGEYQPLSDEKTGFSQRLKIAGPGDLKSPGDDVLFLPYWLLNRDDLFSVIADIRQETAYNQASRFARHIFDLKAEWRDENGLDEELASMTMDSPVPFEIDELIERLEQDNYGMVPGARSEKKGPWNGLLTKPLERLRSKVADRRNGFLFQPPDQHLEPDWLQNFASRLLLAGGDHPGIKVIDLSEVPSDLLPIVVATLARIMYQIQFWTVSEDRLPFCLVCDEAHLYLPRQDQADGLQTQALSSFEKIAKEGRKYGVSLLVVSQRPSDVSTTILSQCSNMLTLRLTNNLDQGVVRRLLPDGMQGVYSALPILETGEGLLLGDAVALPTRIRLDAPNCRPISATRDFWLDWTKQSNSEDTIAAAVAAMRRQSRQVN